MAKTAKIEVRDGDIGKSLGDFLKKILERPDIQALLVAQRLPIKNMVMPTLISDPSAVNGVDPLSPAFPMNAAKILSKLTRKPMGGKIAAVLRSCEIRAFIELVKLHQGRMEDLILIGIDCLGAYQNTDYFEFSTDNGAEATNRFVKAALSGNDDEKLSAACKACEYPVPENADVIVGLLGIETEKELMVQGLTAEGEALVESAGLPEMAEPPARAKAIEELVAKREGFRDRMFEETAQKTDSLEKLTAYMANCVNCYNCRVACPVCYCKECVFVTDVFNHEPIQYLKWAKRKGAIKMPTDTVFYHVTRLAHMGTACVGCGQCSNACPNDIPVMELFRRVSHDVQKAFGYRAGRSIEEKPPLSEFKEKEFDEVVGIN